MSAELNTGVDWEQSKALVVLWHNKWASACKERDELKEKLRCVHCASHTEHEIRNEALKAQLNDLVSEVQGVVDFVATQCIGPDLVGGVEVRLKEALAELKAELDHK